MKTMLLVTLFVTLFLKSNVSAAVAANTRLADKISLFITVCEIKESGGDDKAIGDKHLQKKAFGRLQIRQDAVTDVNNRFGTSYKAEDMLGNRALSVWMCQKYLEMYATYDRLGHEPTFEDLARIWNGGPCGVFDNGAINKKGDLLKLKKATPEQNRRAQVNLARAQKNAKAYAADFLRIMNSQIIAKK